MWGKRARNDVPDSYLSQLKADIAIEHISKAYSKEQLEELGNTMLAVPGVNSWRMVIPMLIKMGVKRVNIAFDMDACALF